jgi:hypothetical protein
MPEMKRDHAIKMLSAQETFDFLSENYDLFDKSSGRYYTIYDILAAINVSEEEIDYVDKFKLEELK